MLYSTKIMTMIIIQCLFLTLVFKSDAFSGRQLDRRQQRLLPWHQQKKTFGLTTPIQQQQQQQQDRTFSIIPARRGTSSLLFQSTTTTTTTTTATDKQDSISSNIHQQNQQEKATTAKKKRRVALLVCPAQFCVPVDYEELWESLPGTIEDYDDEGNNEQIVVDKALSRVVPLSRRDWIKVAKQLPTQNFISANLRNHETLDWYFDALQDGLAQILADDHNTDTSEEGDLSIALVGHSIGGWVARAYLGGLSQSSTAVSQLAQDRVSSLITLGTPHISPESALVDQTRGLLREIDDTPSCSSRSLIDDRGIDVTCVCSSSLAGNIFTTNIEEFVASFSYLPLLGRTNSETKGDGIVPLELAFMEEPARKLVIDTCQSTGKPIRHSHVLPTPWELLDGSAPSIRLPDDVAVSYISPGIVSQWAKFIR